MTDTITLTGLVATLPRTFVTAAGVPIASFRLASTQRRFDRSRNTWVDAETNWYTVSTFRHLAGNVIGSVRKGERVVVVGRLRIREWQAGEKSGINVDVEADAIGHDLTWGTAVWTKTVGATVAAAPAPDSEADQFPAPDEGAASDSLPLGIREPDGSLSPAATVADEVLTPF